MRAQQALEFVTIAFSSRIDEFATNRRACQRAAGATECCEFVPPGGSPAESATVSRLPICARSKHWSLSRSLSARVLMNLRRIVALASGPLALQNAASLYRRRARRLNLQPYQSYQYARAANI